MMLLHCAPVLRGCSWRVAVLTPEHSMLWHSSTLSMSREAAAHPYFWHDQLACAYLQGGMQVRLLCNICHNLLPVMHCCNLSQVGPNSTRSCTVCSVCLGIATAVMKQSSNLSAISMDDKPIPSLQEM